MAEFRVRIHAWKPESGRILLSIGIHVGMFLGEGRGEKRDEGWNGKGGEGRRERVVRYIKTSTEWVLSYYFLTAKVRGKKRKNIEVGGWGERERVKV